jgi:HYR domain
MKHLTVVGLAGLVTVAALQAATAAGSPLRTQSELPLGANFDVQYRFGDDCAAEGAPDGLCVRFRGEALVRGLGRAKVTYVKTVREAADCPVLQSRTAVLTVEGKGTIDLTLPPVCGPTAPASVGPIDVIVAGGSGAFAQASGAVRFRSAVFRPDFTCGPCGRARDTWTGTISVPGLAFDLVPPTLTGATAKVVRAPRGATRVRVRYAVSARDQVDGVVPVSCMPRSGRYFRLGRTTVTCAATDSSANTRRARFTITVRR